MLEHIENATTKELDEMETTTNADAPRYYCPQCTDPNGEAYATDAPTVTGNPETGYTCEVCGCHTYFPEEDGCTPANACEWENTTIDHHAPAHVVLSSTAAVGDLFSVGTYNTPFGELLAGIPERAECFKSAGTNAVQGIELALTSTINALDTLEEREAFALTFTGISSPREYNFSSDTAQFEMYGTASAWDAIAGYCYNEREQFADFLKEHYTSYDGFVSFTANNLQDWECDYYDITAYRHDQAANAAVRFILETSPETAYFVEAFEEETREKLENAQPWEYSESDGVTTLTARAERDSDGELSYTITATDATGTTLYTYTESDPYDEIRSAFIFYDDHDREAVHGAGLEWSTWCSIAHRVF